MSTYCKSTSVPCAWLLLLISPFANADTASVPIPKDALQHPWIHPPGSNTAGATIRAAASAQITPDWSTSDKEIVLHHFASIAHGAYPSSGVIRDGDGTLYGTTNGSYSDIGGGGAKDAGVVFKIDPFGHQSVLYSFTGGVDGGSPNGLLRDAAGNLYGTASVGGASDMGVVFEVDAAGNETVLYSFAGGNDGANPVSLIRDAKGHFHGSTSGGGASGYGVVFKIDSSGKETVLYTFTGGKDGGNPNPNVAMDPAGNFYGTTNIGGNAAGSAGSGVVFKVDPTGHETVLYTFTGGNDGANPNGVIRDSQGNLYGTASDGGALGAGVVFKIDPSGHETVLYTFTGGNDGGGSDAGVIRDRAGTLYGTTDGGGSAGRGVVFKLDPSGHETVLHHFTRGAYGDEPSAAGVILDEAGNLYGTTSFSGAGGAGTVYKLDKFGNASLVYAFPGNEDGQYPYNGGVILGWDGHLYGTTFYGGRNGVGVVYRMDEHGDEQVLYAFDQFTAAGYGQPTQGVTQDFEGNLYGTTFIGQSDMGFGYGVVYKVDHAGHATVLHNFTGGADGGDPYGGVVLDPKGNLYGTASQGGGANAGVIFRIDSSGEQSVLYSFTGGADGGYPYGALIRDDAGNVYGTTNGGGGASGAGVVFKVDPSGRETVLYTFGGGADGGYPLGGLVRDSAGNFYGATGGGGASGAGVVFKLDASGRETVLYSFTGGADGGYPQWVTLARDEAGNLYGTTVGGGTANAGVVFKVDPSGRETVLHSFTGGNDGGNPQSGVILGPKRNLYGVTSFGGRANVGVVFEIKL